MCKSLTNLIAFINQICKKYFSTNKVTTENASKGKNNFGLEGNHKSDNDETIGHHYNS